MSATPFHKFIDLVNYDQHILALTKKKVTAQAHQESLLEEKQAESQRFKVEKEKFHDLKKQRDALELEIASLNQKKKVTERRIATVSSPREYTSLQNELETSIQAIDACESELVELWSKFEEAEDQLKRTENACLEAQKRINAKFEIVQHEYQELEREIATLTKDRTDKCADIPAEWMTNYNALRERVQNPVVPAQDATCTGCFHAVPVHVLNQLRRHVLVTCQNCRRMLYTI